MVKSKSSASDPFVTALRILTRQDRSEAELRNKLKQFSFSAAAIDAAVEKCHGYNYLNDQRYALERARAMIRTGRGVGRRVLLELRRRGIDEALVQQTLETVASEFETDQLLREQLQRRFPNFDFNTADDRQRRRVISFFQRRGFALSELLRILKEDQE